MTEAEIRAFQREHTNHLGEPLGVDGSIGPQTQWALDIDALPLERQRIVQAALEHVGLLEHPLGSNRHPEIDAWLLRCGVSVGLPWCAAFVSHCLRFSGINVHEASVFMLQGRLHNTHAPLPGDACYYLNADGTGHCGILLGLDSVYALICEGNIRHGVRVVRRKRSDIQIKTVFGPAKCAGIPNGTPLASGGTR